MLLELFQELGQSLSLNETLRTLAEKLEEIVPHDALAVYICQDGKLLPEYVNGTGFGRFACDEAPPVEAGIPVLNGDAGKAFGLHSALAVPLGAAGHPVGLVVLYRTNPNAFTAEELYILMEASPKISISVENALRYQRAESSAMTDYVTGLPNRRSLFVHLDAELARCRRNHLTLAVLVCALEAAEGGDRSLQQIAQELRANCREYDFVARMGPDSFVLVLPGFAPSSLAPKIAQLREHTKTMISIGAAFYDADGPDAEQLLAEADRRRFLDKEQQRSMRPSLSRLNLVVS